MIDPNQYIPDWVSDQVTQDYLDRDNEEKNTQTCRNCKMKKGDMMSHSGRKYLREDEDGMMNHFINKSKDSKKKGYLMFKKLIKKWLGIDKMEAQLYNNDKDILGLMDIQFRMREQYPLPQTNMPKSKPVRKENVNTKQSKKGK